MDDDEVDFPFNNRTMFRSLEKTDNQLLIDPSSLRQRYLENVKIFQTALREGCSRNRIDLIPVRTSESYSSIVANYLMQRGRA
jgi:hypothetical protein